MFRNTSIFGIVAFRVIATYLLLVWIEIVVAGDPRFHFQASAQSAGYTVFSVVLLAFTLPQALVLWNQPDLLTQN